MTRRKFLSLAAAAAATSVGGVALVKNVRRRVEVNWHRVGLPGAEGLRVVQVTDLHAGWGVSDEVLEEASEHVRQLDPDLVVLTGDYVNHSLKYLDRATSFVERLPRPCVATLGNHDHWAGAREIIDALEAEDVIVLQNSHIHVDCGHKALTVVGVDDAFTGRDDVTRAFDGIESPDQALCLSHDPNSADDIMAHGARLVLAGHTHGGQIDVPMITPVIARAIGNRYLAGWYDVGPGRLYVNVGLGSSASRWRVGKRAAPEVAVFDIVDEEMGAREA